MGVSYTEPESTADTNYPPHFPFRHLVSMMIPKLLILCFLSLAFCSSFDWLDQDTFRSIVYASLLVDMTGLSVLPLLNKLFNRECTLRYNRDKEN